MSPDQKMQTRIAALRESAQAYLDASEKYRIHATLRLNDDIQIEVRMIETREALRNELDAVLVVAQEPLPSEVEAKRQLFALLQKLEEVAGSEIASAVV